MSSALPAVRDDQKVKVTDNEALIESSFRRLLSSIETERQKIRSTWREIETEDDNTKTELERLRQDTEDWCFDQRTEIDAEWTRLDKLRERMSVLWPDATEMLEINCSGKIFSFPKILLVNIEGSYLNHMFSEAFVQNVPKDDRGRYFLDFNPYCFQIILDYLQKRRSQKDAPAPPVPPELQQSMDILAETLKIKAFLRDNRFLPSHGTSLKVVGSVAEATHTGWQIISGESPIPMSGIHYLEIKVLKNPDPKGGLAFGFCGHMPQGSEVHSIRLQHALLYNSNVGLVGNVTAVENVQKQHQFKEGSLIGIKHDATNHNISWFHNRLAIGVSTLSREHLENMRVLYPVFGLYVPGQKIEVDFNATSPASRPVDPDD